MFTFTFDCHGIDYSCVKGTQYNELVALFHNHDAIVHATFAAGDVTIQDCPLNETLGRIGTAVILPQRVYRITGNLKQNPSLKVYSSVRAFRDIRQAIWPIKRILPTWARDAVRSRPGRE